MKLTWKFLIQNKMHVIAKSKVLCEELKVYPNEPLLKEFDDLKEKLDILFNSYINKTRINDSEWIIWGLDNNYEGPGAYAWENGRIFFKEDIFPLKKAEFEKEEVFIPNNFEKYTFKEYGMRYVEMPNNIGESIHVREFFSGENDLDNIKRLIDEEK